MQRKVVYRQGDVIVTSLSANDLAQQTPREDFTQGTISIEGETGKAHTISGRIAFINQGRSLLLLEAPTELKHEEHGSMTIPAGLYAVARVREWAGRQSRFGGD